MISRSRQALAPGVLLLLAAVSCVFFSWATVSLAISSPWLGLRLAADPASDTLWVVKVAEQGPAARAGVVAGQRLAAIGAVGGPAMTLRAGDLVEEPDALASYAELSEFMTRQTALVEILRQPGIELQVVDVSTAEHQVLQVQPGDRALTDLPVVFWVQLVSGISGFVIGMMAWSIRRDDLATGMFALSGLGLLLSALAAAVYSTRELALGSDVFVPLSTINHLGTHLFGTSMIALFLRYPKPLVRPAALLVLPPVVVAILVADLAHRTPAPVTATYVPILVELMAIIGLILVQWRLARRDPTARAALRWLGLSVVVGAGAFAIGIGAPLLMDAAPVLSQGYAFAFFLLVYGGIALGIRRYRLFELGDWAFRILFYTAGAVLILLLDALLIWLLHLDHQPALGLSLLLVGFIWLPLRDALWRRMNKKRQFSKDALFTAAMGVAFGITRGERAERWQRLLRQLFDPLEISTLESAVSKVTVAMDGLEMHLPPVADSPALRLRYPFAGKDLFGPSELKLALQFVALITQAETSRDAYNRGVTEERQRIAQDLHDDVGARLLSGIHGADERTRPLLHAALSDIRSIVSGLSGEGSTLDQVLIEARHEAARRLEAAGIALAWPAWLEGAEQVVLDYAPAKALHSSLREIVSNIIRHAAATQVHAQLTLRGQSLELQIRDDGCGLPVDEPKRKGYGLDNIRRRIESVGGQLRFSSHPGQGTHVEITLPLPAGPTRTRTSAAIAVK